MIETTAREWTNPSTGEVRNYVTNMTDLINNIPGWEVTYWGTGTVKAILRNGMELSKRETANLRNTKAWIDGAGEIHIESYAEAITVEQFTEAVRVGMPAPVTARLSAPHPLDGAREVANLAELLAAAGHTLTREEENSCRYSRTWITADGTIKSLARLDRIGGRATVQTVVSEALR